MRLAPLLLVAACGGGAAGPMVTVIAQAGSDAAAGASVISHRPDGEVIDEAQADAVGHAKVVVEEGALVSVVFPADLAPDASFEIVTTLAPPAGDEVVIRGPRPAPPPTVAGALEVMPDQALAADDYELHLGCATIEEPTLPATVDVAAHCLGSDANLDVLVLGRAGTPPQVVGYAAGRVPLAGGAALFEPPAWQTRGPTVSVTLEGVQPQVSWTLYADGLPIVTEPLTDGGQLWTGLMVDQAEVTATLGDATASQVTTQWRSPVPLGFTFETGDFLAPVAPALALADPQHLALTWNASDIGADAVDLHLAWTVGRRNVTWDAVLPPDATAATFPAFDNPAIAGLVGPPDATPTALLRYVDSNGLEDFTDLRAAGVDATDPTSPSIAPPIAYGEIRISEAAGIP